MQLTTFIERRFAGLFVNTGKDDKQTVGKHFHTLIRERQEERFCANIDVARAIGVTQLKCSIYEYYLIIEKLNTDASKTNASTHKQSNNGS